MDKILQMIIVDYQRNLGRYFPQDRLGIADRSLFNQAIIEVAYKNSKFNQGRAILAEQIEFVEDIMRGYGFKPNFRKG